MKHGLVRCPHAWVLQEIRGGAADGHPPAVEDHLRVRVLLPAPFHHPDQCDHIPRVRMLRQRHQPRVVEGLDHRAADFGPAGVVLDHELELLAVDAADQGA